MSEKQSAWIGGEGHRDGGPSPNLGGRLDGWNQGAQPTPATPAPDEAKPASAEALALLDEAQEGATENRPALDADDVAEFSAKLAAGMSPIEAAKHMGLTSAELAELQGAAPAAEATTRQSIEAELAKIAALRRTDSRAYWADEKLQARERELLAARATAKAEASTTNAAPASTTSDTDKRLEEIRKLRATSPEAYWKSNEIQEEELRLLEARATASEGASENAALQSFIDAVRGSLEDATELETSFDAVFPTLPAEAQDRVRWELTSPTEPTRRATEKEVAAFAERPEGAQLVAEWGAQTPQKIARFQARVRAMARADKDGALAAWLGERTPEQAAAVARALAGG
jgi:hypothetical protein